MIRRPVDPILSQSNGFVHTTLTSHRQKNMGKTLLQTVLSLFKKVVVFTFVCVYFCFFPGNMVR